MKLFINYSFVIIQRKYLYINLNKINQSFIFNKYKELTLLLNKGRLMGLQIIINKGKETKDFDVKSYP
jgi:hypothetical protein